MNFIEYRPHYIPETIQILNRDCAFFLKGAQLLRYYLLVLIFFGHQNLGLHNAEDTLLPYLPSTKLLDLAVQMQLVVDMKIIIHNI